MHISPLDAYYVVELDATCEAENTLHGAHVSRKLRVPRGWNQEITCKSTFYE